MKASPFSVLVAAMSAIVQHDEAALAASLERVPPEQLLGQSIRHKCTGLLYEGLAASTIRTEPARALLRGTRGFAQTALLEAPAVRAQLEELSNALGNAAIPHAPLKTGARLLDGERVAEVTPIFDLDILIPEGREKHALAALARIGYVVQPGPFFAGPKHLAGYRRFHHHLEPLAAEGLPKIVELHWALAMPWCFSLPLTWRSLRPCLENRTRERPYEFRLSPFAAALHLVIHGTGIYRLYDTVILALALRREPSLGERLQRALIEERVQPLGTAAVLLLAASMADIPLDENDATRAFLDWVYTREALPVSLHNRALYVDMWYGNGGSAHGTCTTMIARTLAKEAKWHGIYWGARYAASMAWGSVAAAFYSTRIRA